MNRIERERERRNRGRGSLKKDVGGHEDEGNQYRNMNRIEGEGMANMKNSTKNLEMRKSSKQLLLNIIIPPLFCWIS